ncbi:MAG: glycoside hydrolase family 15 protein [Myxococcota bacterium]
MRRIEDYALLGDCHSAALVARDGSVDWACFPRFDSPAVFCRILDAERGGSFSVACEGPADVRRSYLPDTNVLVTTFLGPEGALELVDCMPLRADPADPARPIAQHAILRRVRCLRGRAVLRVALAPRFEYGSFVPRFSLLSPHEASVVGGADAIFVTATEQLGEADARIRGRWPLRAGDEVWVECRWCRADGQRRQEPSIAVFEEKLDATIGFWQRWMASCRAGGQHAALVRRSALVLKALTFAPTGAVVAAPTTSLPEELGGERNWDYRYTWIRDATLTLTSLMVSGSASEASAFKGWVERTGAGRPEDLRIMYGIKGRRALPEIELPHLAGHRGSRPVRIGNGAAGQTQLDCYGQLLESAWLYQRIGGAITEGNWRVLGGYADVVCRRWREPDHGLWEIREEPRHFLHSKVHCWMALDRAVQLAKGSRSGGAAARWARERDAIERTLLEDASGRGWFSQALGSDLPDASALVVPALGFLPPTDPRVLRTLETVSKELGVGGLLRRYRASDGLEGGEGAFLLCSFWLVDALAHAGRVDEAEGVLAQLLGLANDVGLFAEEADPGTGELLGNFPQAFTHMALVTSCAHLEAARRGELPGPRRYDFADFLIRRSGAAIP